ncbi:serine hydrolase domain-containing protein [Allofournierella sp.]|uniref:serine hydrolase domain-containing protein n=3 Tax=Allofournierella sp. TaxID=1940256 RepID=UPI003AF5A078
MFETACSLLQHAVTAGRCPGAALAMGCRGRLLAQAYFGTMAPLDAPFEPVGPHTVYDLASLSKVVAATTLLLQDFASGALSPQDPLRRFFAGAGPQKGALTLAQLLTHTAGLKSWARLDLLGPPPAAAAETILSMPLAYAPGSQVVYSDLGFILLGRVLELVHGAPLPQLARQRVFAPLGMAHTGYAPPPALCAPTERDERGAWLRGVVHDENARFLGGDSGNAGVFSTLPDLARYAAALACGGSLEGVELVPAATLRAACQNATPGLGQNRGLGFQLAGAPGDFFGPLFSPAGFGHTGFTGTSLAVDPAGGLFVVLLTNRVHPARQPDRFVGLRAEIHSAILQEWRAQQGGNT